jgi:hypothetical protein
LNAKGKLQEGDIIEELHQQKEFSPKRLYCVSLEGILIINICITGEVMRELVDDEGENRAVRMFLLLYNSASPTALQMKEHLANCGYDCAPDWVERSPGYLTKAGAQLWLRMLFDLEKKEKKKEALLAIGRIMSYSPCMHENLDTSLGDSKTWAKCDDCGATIEQSNIEKYRARSIQFDMDLGIILSSI